MLHRLNPSVRHGPMDGLGFDMHDRIHPGAWLHAELLRQIRKQIRAAIA